MIQLHIDNVLMSLVSGKMCVKDFSLSNQKKDWEIEIQNVFLLVWHLLKNVIF